MCVCVCVCVCARMCVYTCVRGVMFTVVGDGHGTNHGRFDIALIPLGKLIIQILCLSPAII